MGMDFECGCRKSMFGNWTLCDEHEELLANTLQAQCYRNDEGELADEQRESLKEKVSE